jgi:GNAT superfamily N-acetyltransferase
MNESPTPQAGNRAKANRGLIRRLWPSDRDAFRAHLLRLAPESRFERFAMEASDEFLCAYADRCFGIDDVIYGYFVDGVVHGAAELRPLAPGAGDTSAEAAFSVESDWCRQGIGTELMERIVRAARARDADTLYMSCLAGNKAMRGLARKFSAALEFDDDPLTGRLVARTPRAAALWQEWLADSSSFATAMLDLNRNVYAMRRGARRADP